MLIRTLLAGAAVLLAVLPAQAQRCAPIRQASPADSRPDARRAADSVRAAQTRAVVDSLRSDVMSGARQAGVAEPAGLVVLVVRDRAAEAAEIHMHRTNVTEALVAEAVARRAPMLAAVPANENTLHFRLDPVLLDSAATVECRPAPRNVDRFHRELRAIERRESPVGARVEVLLRMLVTREGEVAYAAVRRPSPWPALDDAVVDAARRTLRFQPASVAGTPVDIWVELPVHLTLQGRG